MAIETVLAWHAAVNQSDVERLLSLSTEDVEVGGPDLHSALQAGGLDLADDHVPSPSPS
jgi:ketosteroid isomerase-like protein